MSEPYYDSPGRGAPIDGRIGRIVLWWAVASVFIAVCDFVQPFLESIVGGNILAVYVIVGIVAAAVCALLLRRSRDPSNRTALARFGFAAGSIASISAVFLAIATFIPAASATGVVAQVIPNGTELQQALLARLGAVEERIAVIDERTQRIEQGTQRIEQGTQRIEQKTETIGTEVVAIREVLARQQLKPLAIHEMWWSRNRRGDEFNYRIGSLSDVDNYRILDLQIVAELADGTRARFSESGSAIGPGGEIMQTGLPIAAPVERVRYCAIYTIDGLERVLKDERLLAKRRGPEANSVDVGVPELAEASQDELCQ